MEVSQEYFQKSSYHLLLANLIMNLEYLRNSEISSIPLRFILPISDSYGIVNIQKEPFSSKLEMALYSVLPPYICDDFEARIRIATSRSSQSSYHLLLANLIMNLEYVRFAHFFSVILRFK